MKGDIGTILYIVFLIVFSLAGMFRKKKKVEEEERRKKMMQTQAEEAGAEEDASSGPEFATGNPLVDALLGAGDKTPFFEEEEETLQEVEENAYAIEQEEEQEPEVFLPPEEEGQSALASRQEKKKETQDKNRIVADQPDWQKFMDEQNEEETSEILRDFDPVKAVINSEIMERKYF